MSFFTGTSNFVYKEAPMKTVLLLHAALIALTACISDPVLQELSDYTPEPELSPTQVVYIQVEALRHNDDRDNGIKIAARFNSPENRMILQENGSFAEILRGESFMPLLFPVRIVYYRAGTKDGYYFQPVEISSNEGRVMVYLFYLSLQTEPPYEDCWMVDGVQSYELQPGAEDSQEGVPPIKELGSSDGILQS